MNLYHIKLTDNQKAALEHLFSRGIEWNKTELEMAWHELREQLKDSVQSVAIINALQDSGCNCKKPTEPAPKYDPCRLLRKGDKVRVKKRDGRCNGKAGEYLREAFCTVAEDETQNELVRVLHNATEYRLDPAYLELVTPVEELEISRVFDDKKMGAWIVTKDNFTHAYFPYRCKVSDNIASSKEEAKAAAEAERDRLNAEYRKEQSNA